MLWMVMVYHPQIHPNGDWVLMGTIKKHGISFQPPFSSPSLNDAMRMCRRMERDFPHCLYSPIEVDDEFFRRELKKLKPKE